MKLVSRVVEPALDMTTQWIASDTFDHKGRCEELKAQVDAIKELSRKVGVGVDVDGVDGVAQWSRSETAPLPVSTGNGQLQDQVTRSPCPKSSATHKLTRSFARAAIRLASEY